MAAETLDREYRARNDNWRWRCASFLDAEEGAQTIEVLLIFVSIIVPCFASSLLLQEVLCEYLEVEIIILTSPFF